MTKTLADRGLHTTYVVCIGMLVAVGLALLGTPAGAIAMVTWGAYMVLMTTRSWRHWQKTRTTPAPDRDPEWPEPGWAGRATLRVGDASWHDGAGWYYTIDEYPDEGSTGAFATVALAVAHAERDGYDIKSSFPLETA